MITSIYTKLFVLFYHLFFLLDNGSFQDSCTNNSFGGFFLSVIYQTLQLHYYVYIGFNVHEQFFFLIQSQRQLPLNITIVCNLFIWFLIVYQPKSCYIWGLLYCLIMLFFFLGCCEFYAYFCTCITNEKKRTLSRTIKRVGWSGQCLYLINHLKKTFRDLGNYSKAKIHVLGIFCY